MCWREEPVTLSVHIRILQLVATQSPDGGRRKDLHNLLP